MTVLQRIRKDFETKLEARTKTSGNKHRVLPCNMHNRKNDFRNDAEEAEAAGMPRCEAHSS